MSDIFNRYLDVIIFISIIIAILIFYIVKIIALLKNEKRISKFTINSNSDAPSLIDDVLNIFNRFVVFISKVLNKSTSMKKYATRLEKYLVYESDSKLTPIDHISIKFIIMIGIQLLYILTMLIKHLSFNFSGFVLTSALAFFFTDIILFVNYRKRKELIEEQLLQAIVIMNSAFKSGKNISQAIEIVKYELSSPIKEEFMIVSKDLSYGLDLETVFNRFAKRIKIEEAKYITSSLALLNKTGGNIVTVFNMIESNFYERIKIKNELSALTSSSRYMYRMLLILPFIFVILIVCLNPSYFMPLVTTTIGKIIIGAMIILYITYIFVIKKVMRIDTIWK